MVLLSQRAKRRVKPLLRRGLPSKSDRRIPSVDQEICAGDKGRFVACQEYRARSHLGWIAKAPKEGGRVGVRLLFTWPLTKETIIRGWSRGYRISPDIIFGVINSEGLHQADERAFLGNIPRPAWLWRKS